MLLWLLLVALVAAVLIMGPTGTKLAIFAVWGLIQAKFASKGPLVGSAEQRQLYGRKVVLITGANRGLGKGIATDLAAAGFQVILACRSGLDTAAQEVVDEANQFLQTAKGHSYKVEPAQVRCVSVDIGSLKSISKCVAQLKSEGVKLAALVTNAAVVPVKPELNAEGLENSFAINYFGHFFLAKRLIEENILPLPKDSDAVTSESIPRIVVVSSESHRASKPLSSFVIGEPVQYTMGTALDNYAFTKLLTATFAHELARRVNVSAKRASCNVTAICPGPVDTNIAHHAPPVMQFIAKIMLRLFFVSPLKAARPITTLLTRPVSLDDRECRYFHQQVEKPAGEQATNPAVGAKLWEDTEALLRKQSRFTSA